MRSVAGSTFHCAAAAFYLPLIYHFLFGPFTLRNFALCVIIFDAVLLTLLTRAWKKSPASGEAR